MQEQILIALCCVMALGVLYWLGSIYANRRKSKAEVKNILSINQRYKDLVEREESL